MASFSITFEDTEDGGMKSSIEVKGFAGVQYDNLDKNTCAQNLFLAVNNFLTTECGLKIPRIDPSDTHKSIN